jgi:hypothetical protein
MKTLLAKELRAQRPFLVLILFLVALEFAEYFVTKAPDARTLPSLLNEHGQESVAGVMLMILALTVALALLPRERDEGTLEFLDALPCTRSQIFGAKTIAGIFIMGLYPLLENAAGLLLHRLSHTSLDEPWPWRLVGEMFAIEWFVAASLLGLGLALSYFRRFAFFVLGLFLAIYFALQAAEVSWVHYLDIISPLRYSFRAGHIDIAWRELAATGAFGAAGYLIAWAVFQMQGDRAARITGWLERSHLRGPLVALGTVAMIALWFGLAARLAADREEEEGSDPSGARVVYRDWQTSQLRAGGYVFLYPSNLRDRATALAEKAGSIQESVRTFLGAEPAGEIVTDLDSHLRHVSGTAEWKRINMSIIETEELSEQTAVLGHETTHVYIDFLAEGRIAPVFSSCRWWHEGLASYVEFRLFRPPGDQARIQRVAAAAHRRKASEFELLVNDAAWREKHDPDLVYALGEVFCEALVATQGDDAPGKILRAFARKDAPEGLTGLDLWRDTFQACGWDLSTTIARYYQRLQELADGSEKTFVDSLPRIRGRVLVEKQEVAITAIPAGTLPEGAELCGRVRRYASDGDEGTRYLSEDELGKFTVDRGWLGEGEFWYQLGINHPDAQFSIWEDWQRARVK